MKNTGGSNMNGEISVGHQKAPRKPYHAPELTALGPIESVVRNGNFGPGADKSFNEGSSAS